MLSKAKANAITGFLTQLIILLLGLIVPRIILVNYGSDTNGLTNTLTQVFSYVALLEAGIGQATRNILYKPISTGDHKECCKILSASRKYYWKITKYYFLIVLLMTIILPLVLKSELTYSTVAAVIFFEGLSGVVRFLFTENWMQLLYADGKGYVQANINLAARFFTYGIKIVLACFQVNIVFIQIGYFFISLIQLLIYKLYIKRNYPWLQYSLSDVKAELKDRNSYILTEIAWTIFSSTDMIILSILFSTQLASVYSVYNMVYSNISILLSSIYNNLLYLLGRSFHKGIEEYTVIHDQFELLFMTAIVFFMTCCSVLTIPFVRIYTAGVTDINYIYIYLPLLMGLIQILSWFRYITGNLSGIAGYAKIVARISVIESLLNIALSIIFSKFLGLYGVTLATVISLVLKLVYLTYLGNVVIMKRNVNKSIKKMVCLLFFYILISCYFIFNNLNIDTLSSFILYGSVTFFVLIILYSILTYFMDKESMILILKKIKK